MTEEEMNNLIAAMNGEAGDLLLFAADKNKLYGMFLEIYVWNWQNRWNFWTRISTISCGLQNSRCLSGAMTESLSGNASPIHDADGRRSAVY